jgi:hypothetical protein
MVELRDHGDRARACSTVEITAEWPWIRAPETSSMLEKFASTASYFCIMM